MTESKDELRARRFQEAQQQGWEYHDQTSQAGEGLTRKTVMQFNHPDPDSKIRLFIGPRGGLKTGRNYKSSACQFWEETPTPAVASKKHG